MPATAAAAAAPAVLDPSLCGSSRFVETRKSTIPSILATDYQPKDASAANQPEICISFDDLDELLPEAAQNNVMQKFTPRSVLFSSWTEDPVPVYVAPVGRVRFVVLGDPERNWVCEEVEGRDKIFRRLAKGDKLGGRLKSCARLLVAMVLDEELIADERGVPVVFSLGLKSNKVSLIGQKEPGRAGSPGNFDYGASYNGGWRTIAALNAALIAHYEPQLGGAKYPRGARLVQQVSVEITPVPERFGSGREISWGIRFTLGAKFEGGRWQDNCFARPLAREQQAVLRALETSDWFQTIQSDPFGVKSEGRLPPQFAQAVWAAPDGEAIPF